MLEDFGAYKKVHGPEMVDILRDKLKSESCESRPMSVLFVLCFLPDECGRV